MDSIMDKEMFSGEVIGCNVGEIIVRIHLPDGDSEENEIPTDQQNQSQVDDRGKEGESESNPSEPMTPRTKKLLRRQFSAPMAMVTSKMSLDDEERQNTLNQINKRPLTSRHTMAFLSEYADGPLSEIVPSKLHYIICPDSPTQTEISWNAPKNSCLYASISYKLQLHKGGDEDDWISLNDRNLPFIRIYIADERFVMDRMRVEFPEVDITWSLRVMALGKSIDGRTVTETPWCSEIKLLLSRTKQCVNEKENEESSQNEPFDKDL